MATVVIALIYFGAKFQKALCDLKKRLNKNINKVTNGGDVLFVRFKTMTKYLKQYNIKQCLKVLFYEVNLFTM